MPSTPFSLRPKRDSWPPTQVHMHHNSLPSPSDEMGMDLDVAAIDEDPLTFFLTPAPSVEEEFGAGIDLDMMEFDAGIEDSKHPREIVRSISPSSLGGSRSRASPPRTPPLLGTMSPPRSPVSRGSPDLGSDYASTIDDNDNDSEEYIRFIAGRPLHPQHSLPLSLHDFTKMKVRRDAGLGFSGALRDLEVPARPRSPRRGLVRRTSAHAWREPSPDVWSIEEEAEEDNMKDAKAAASLQTNNGTTEGEQGKEGATMPIDIPAAKLKKKVRFVLPAQEI